MRLSRPVIKSVRLEVRTVTRSYFLVSMFLAGIRGSAAQGTISYDRVELKDGGRLLVVKGPFESSDDPERLVAEYNQFQPSFVTFDSPGGSVSTALRFVRALRSLKADTLQFSASLCVSACSLVFVGGVHRLAEPGSIGVHQSSFSDDAALDSKTAVSSVQALTADIFKYLLEMGVSPNLLQLSLSVDSSDMRYLTKAEMADWNITTPEQSGGTPPGQPPGRPPAASPVQPAPPEPMRFVLRPHFDLADRDINSAQTGSGEECESRCLSTSGCKAFTFNIWNSVCFPQDRRRRSEDGPALRLRSGVRPWPAG
jgi:hypothetical protein